MATSMGMLSYSTDEEDVFKFGTFLMGNDVEYAQQMINEGRIDVNANGWEDWTPLMLAADEGLIDVVSNLLRRGADLNRQNKHGDTALKLAVEKGYFNVAQLLLKQGAHPHVINAWVMYNFWSKSMPRGVFERITNFL